MEPLDVGARPSVGLPPINHMDPDRIKREEPDYPMRSAAAAFTAHDPASLRSSHQPLPASAMPASLGGLLSPADSRKAAGDESEPPRPNARQSLPSIHEALGPEQPLSYPPQAAPAPQHHQLPSSNTSPAEQRPRHLPTDLHAGHGPANPFVRPRSPYAVHAAAHGPAAPSQAPSDVGGRPAFGDTHPFHSPPQHAPKLPSLHPLKTTQSPPPGAPRPGVSYSYPTRTSSYEAAASSPAPVSSYQYPHYSPGHPRSAPVQAAPSAAYPTSTPSYSAPPRYPPPASWRDGAEMARLEEKKINRSSLAPYGESVKRHLESFDLEASLNEMADGSGHISEFSKIYRQRAYENQRIGMTPQSMPRLEEVDEMLKQSEKIQISLQRMRNVVYNHQQASIAEAPQDHRYRPTNGYDHDSNSNYGDDSKGGGFAGGDSKTRKRGRAAPPGRCHSCARAETPEWRRGPDGARTLCNACGLHYAKLTRKMGGKPSMTSSNLRPKSMDQSPPNT